MASKFKPGDKVDVVLGPKRSGRIRGEVEDITSRGVGVRYENGNFKWIKDESRIEKRGALDALTQRVLRASAADKLARRFMAAAVIVGDIFVSSWGYDQTNIDFYQVVRTTKTMIVIRKIDKKLVGGRGEPQEKVMPVANTMKGPELRKKLKEYRGRPYVTLNSYASAYKWDGKPAWQTGGAFGH